MYIYTLLGQARRPLESRPSHPPTGLIVPPGYGGGKGRRTQRGRCRKSTPRPRHRPPASDKVSPTNPDGLWHPSRCQNLPGRASDQPTSRRLTPRGWASAPSPARTVPFEQQLRRTSLLQRVCQETSTPTPTPTFSAIRFLAPPAHVMDKGLLPWGQITEHGALPRAGQRDARDNQPTPGALLQSRLKPSACLHTSPRRDAAKSPATSSAIGSSCHDGPGLVAARGAIRHHHLDYHHHLHYHHHYHQRRRRVALALAINNSFY